MTTSQTMNNIEWRDIPGYEGLYQVSNDGQVMSSRYNRLIGWFYNNGYRRTTLSKHNVVKHYRVHNLVMLAFVGSPPDGMCVNHKNGDKEDNRLENLEYVTFSENTQHMLTTLKSHNPKHGESHPCAKLTEGDVREIRKLRKEGYSYNRLAKHFKVSVGSIRQVTDGRSWKHVADESDVAFIQSLAQEGA